MQPPPIGRALFRRSPRATSTPSAIIFSDTARPCISARDQSPRNAQAGAGSRPTVPDIPRPRLPRREGKRANRDDRDDQQSQKERAGEEKLEDVLHSGNDALALGDGMRQHGERVVGQHYVGHAPSRLTAAPCVPRSVPSRRWGRSISGAPSTYTPRSGWSGDGRRGFVPSAAWSSCPSKTRALHLRAEEKGTSSITGCFSPGSACAIASLVLLLVVALATKPLSRLSSSSRPIPRGRTSASFRWLVVRVPVLSRQNVSTLLSDSMALVCCTSAPWPATRMAPSA